MDHEYEADLLTLLDDEGQEHGVEIIDELEPERRGIYGGGMGYLDFGGNMDICITIRTMVKKNDRVYIQAGGGIVADSVLDNEFQETVNKAGAA